MKKYLMTGAAILALGTAANASTFSIVGGDPGVIPGGATNEVLVNVFGQPDAMGFYGASILLDADADVKVDILGYEAGFTNSFTYGLTNDTDDVEAAGGDANGDLDSEYAADPLSPIISYTQFGESAGLLGFSFFSPINGGTTVVNGANPDNTDNKPNFFASYGRGGQDTVYLWFDDGGAGNDDNHDDFVVRLTTNDEPPGPIPTPLPAAGWMLVAALGGLGFAKRRKTA